MNSEEKQRDEQEQAEAPAAELEPEATPQAEPDEDSTDAAAEAPTEEVQSDQDMPDAVAEDSDEPVESEEAAAAEEAPAEPARARAATRQREQAPDGIPALFGRKLGMLQVFDEAGTVQNVTALELGPCVVTMVRTPQRDGYSAVQLGWGDPRKLNKPAKGHLKAADGEFRFLREVRVEDSGPFTVGQEVTTSIFQPGERVDVTSTSKGRGFAGGVKRHGFHGGPKTHGQSDRHRAPGSIGAGTTPGHVLKGQKMAGHMGAQQVTVRSLAVVRSEGEKNLLLVRGSVPGPVNGLVRVKRTTREVQK